MSKLLAVVVLGLFSFNSHAYIVSLDGGSPAPEYSASFKASDPRVKDCVLSELRGHVEGGAVEGLTIDNSSVSIGRCFWYDCVNVSFKASKGNATYSGSAYMVIAAVNSAGDPSRCQLYERDLEYGDEILALTAHGRRCNTLAEQSLSVVSGDNIQVINGCGPRR